MAYMSYCRYEGTKMELNTCLHDVEEHVNEEAEYEVSDREINHFRNMVKTFWGWMQDMCLVDEYGELDRDVLEDICQKMARGYDEKEDDVYF